MDSYVARVLSSLLINSALLALYLNVSGAPIRVHFASFTGLIAAFVVPAQFVGSPLDLAEQWPLLLVLTILGLAIYHYLSVQVIVKAESSFFAILFLLPFLWLLLLAHSFVASFLSRSRIKTH